MRSGAYFFREVLPFVGMLAAECIGIGMSTMYKAAVTKGLNYHVYMVYYFGISALTLLPLTWLFHRKTPLPPINIILLCKFFFLGFLGFAGQFLGNLGVSYSSPTMNSAMSNLTPATTFFLAILFRMEKLNLKRISSQAKIIGAVVSISGALVVVLYNGPMLINGNQKHLFSSTTVLFDARSNWILGGALCGACYVTASTWIIYQGVVVKEYPAEFVLVFFYGFAAFLYSLPIGIALVPNPSSWKVPADIRLLSILFSGIGQGATNMIWTWGLQVKGPLYVAMFKPLSIAIAAFAGVLFLSDDLYTGSVIGSIIIAIGFYTAMWGKLKEDTIEESDDNDLESSTEDVIVPLLKK